MMTNNECKYIYIWYKNDYHYVTKHIIIIILLKKKYITLLCHHGNNMVIINAIDISKQKVTIIIVYYLLDKMKSMNKYFFLIKSKFCFYFSEISSIL